MRIPSIAKWLENGEKNTSDFFALEKLNFKSKSFSSLKISEKLCQDTKQQILYGHSINH